MNNKLVIVIIMLFIVFTTACSTNPEVSSEDTVVINSDDSVITKNSEGTLEVIDLPVICESLDGLWLEEFQECEGISNTDCISLDGTFDECASACRNDPTAEMCTLQCVQVCDFD